MPTHLRGAAARLYWRGLGGGLQPVPTHPRDGAALIAAVMVASRALAAVSDRGTLVGIAGLRGAQGGFLSPAAADFHQVFGGVRGGMRHLGSRLHRPGRETPDLILDGVAVRPHWRGRGVARALVAAALQEARDLGHPALMAEVEARNHAALAAWLALGFHHAGRQRLGWPWHPPAHVLRRVI